MPSLLHETLARGVGSRIEKGLENITENDSNSDKWAINAAESILWTGSYAIDFLVSGKPPDKKAPDESFRHEDCKFPGLVLEVAWSQRSLDLPLLAEQYIQRSRASIRTVVGLNLNEIYQEQREKAGRLVTGQASATFSIWRAKLEEARGQEAIGATEGVIDKVESRLQQYEDND